MTTRTWLPAQDPLFDGFLFAPVGDDRNGMRVSVLSALARLGVDPWQEAKQLAGLPAESARQRLDTLIAALPGIPSLALDHRAIASRLIALLPRQASFGSRAGTPIAGDDTVALKRTLSFVAIIAYLLVSQTLAHMQDPSTQGDPAKAPISTLDQTGK